MQGTQYDILYYFSVYSGDKVSARWHSLSAYRLNIIATALGFVILLTMYVMYVATDWLDQENGYLFKLPRRLKQSAAKKQ